MTALKGIRDLILSTAALVLLHGCGGFSAGRPWNVSADDWPMMGRLMSRTNANDHVTLAVPMRTAWTYEANAGISAQPLLCNGMLLIATMKGDVHVVDAQTGQHLDKHAATYSIVATPALGDSTLFIPFANGTETLEAFDLSLGEVRWRKRLGPIEASPLWNDGSLFVSTLNGRVMCLNAADGIVRWTFRPDSSDNPKPIRSSIAANDSLLFFGSDGGILYAIDRATGSLRWMRRFGSAIFGAPVVTGKRVVAAGLRGEIACFDALSGMEQWRTSVDGLVYGSPASDGVRIFVGTAARLLYALDLVKGSVLWRVQTEGPVSAAPAVADSLVFVGSLDRSLTVFAAATGDVRWSQRLDARVRVAPLVWRNLSIIVTDDRIIRAYLPATD